MNAAFGPRRGMFLDIQEETRGQPVPLTSDELESFERFDLIYRSLCAMLFNYVPMSGHPGGSISSGRFAAALLFESMDYDMSLPDRQDADIISYAAGHKALGLYALWALRDEIVRIGAPGLHAGDARQRLRLEDLLGFRKNPVGMTALQKKLAVKALDGHPTPATPFVQLSTGASGVGLAGSIGLAIGALDHYGRAAPFVHIVEGEGGMTPGRVSEAMAAAGTMSIGNAVLHVDWNQASIDSNKVCRDGNEPGDYVQWTPAELAALHDWNVIQVPDGMSFQQIVAAQRRARSMENGQPTAIIYRTVKGWQYGIEGRASHGAGHKLCADGFFDALDPLLREAEAALPRCAAENQRCKGGSRPGVMDECFWEALGVIRAELQRSARLIEEMSGRITAARARLDGRGRTPRADHPRVELVPGIAAGIPSAGAARAAQRTSGAKPTTSGAAQRAQRAAGTPLRATPNELRLKPGAVTTLRGELGRALGYCNMASGGALLIASADLMGSTSSNTAATGFPQGYFNGRTNPGARLLSTGGICEDAMTGILAGISAYGSAIGVGSSYGAFLAPLGHIAARLHAIGFQARHARKPAGRETFLPLILVCAHAGLKTGEDGPTHADPQALQLLQGNFPRGTLITLTPWEPQEIWPLLSAAIELRPAVIAVFVTRPNETVPDRAGLGLAPAEEAAGGVYRLVAAHGKRAECTVVLQGSEVAYAFVQEAVPLLAKAGIDLEAYYVSSAELFDMQSPARQAAVFSEKTGTRSLGITGFTLPTMHRWITSELGRRWTMHPFSKGHFLGSGQAEAVMREAGLDGRGQVKAIKGFLRER